MFPIPFQFTEPQRRLRGRVHDLLTRPVVRREMAAIHAGTEHARQTYELLGSRGWLAIDWPRRYGGLGAGPTESAIIAEEMALAGVPDSVRVNTVDNLGSTLLRAGTEAQRSAYLPAIARGELVGCVLYSEPDAGSDLGALTTSAVRDGSGWRLRGTKVWSVGACWADLGICAARTEQDAGSRYDGISLFLVPLRAEGVRVEQLSSMNPEQFHQVTFDDVAVPGTALVGRPGQAWALIGAALGMERTGVCFLGRARRWLDLLACATGDRPMLRQLDAELRAARLVVWRCVELMALDAESDVAAASAKWWASELAAEIAQQAWEAMAGLPADERHQSPWPELSWAIREAPGLRLAAGTSEVMLATVSSALLDGAEAAR